MAVRSNLEKQRPKRKATPETMKPFTHEQLRRYLEAQLDEIQKFKWIESERANEDIGFDRAAFEWIRLHGDSFRREWLGKLSSFEQSPLVN